MEYRKIEGLETPLSRIVMGGSSSGMRKGENCDEILDAALSFGINTFDTARGYGKSEEVLADWADRRGVRDRILIQTKGALHGMLGNNRVNVKCIRKDFEASLRALRTDCIDIYILHRDNEKMPVAPIVDLLNEFQAKGQLKIFGGSNWSYRRFEEANEYAYKHGLSPMRISEPHYSLAEVNRWAWIGCTTLTGEAHMEERAWYEKTGFPLVAFSPLAGGFMTGRIKSDDYQRTVKNVSFDMRRTFATEKNRERLKRAELLAKEKGCAVSQIALAWVLESPMNTFAIIGNSRVSTMKTSIDSLAIKLTAEERAYLNLED